MKPKKVQVQHEKKFQTSMKRKTPEHKSSYQKYLTCLAKRFPGIKLILNLKLRYKITSADCHLLSFL